MRAFVLSLAVLGVLASAAAAEEAFTIKASKFVAKGKTVKVNEKSVYNTVVKITDDNGNAAGETKEKKTLLRVYTETTHEVNKDKRTKFSRKYEKAKDLENDESETKPYQGRTIVFEGTEGKYKLQAEGKPALDKDDLSELADDVNKETEKSEEVFFPKNQVKVGDKWRLDGKEIASFFDELKMDAASVKGEGKLVKAYKKGEKQWGTVELTLTFKAELEEIKEAGGEMKITLDQPLDGSTVGGKGVIRLTLAGTQKIDEGCKKFVADVRLTATITVDTTADEK